MQSLVAYIAHTLIAPALQKGWFSAPHVRFRRYLGLYQEAFEIGAVLGYTYRSNMPSLAQLFSESGRERDLVSVIQELARKRLSDAPDAKDFSDLAFFAEEERFKVQWRTKMTSSEQQQLDQMTDRLKMPLDTTFGNIQVAVSTGIGFGSAYPELTERFWKLEHERPVTQNEVDAWREAGLEIPAEIPPSVTLPQMEGQARSQVEEFVSRARPELLTRFKSMSR